MYTDPKIAISNEQIAPNAYRRHEPRSKITDSETACKTTETLQAPK
jgi:hypothetical protein